MTKHRLNEYAIFSAKHNVIDIYEFEWDAENVLKEHQANGDYEGAYVSNVMITVEKIEDMKRFATDTIKKVMAECQIESDSPVHLMSKRKGLRTALDLLELGGPSDD